MNPASTPPLPQYGPGNVGKGLVFTLLLHFCQIVLIPIIIAVSMVVIPDKNGAGIGGFVVAILGFGVTQLIYMIPAILIFKKRGETKTVQGLVIGASVTFLLSAMCSAPFLYGIYSHH